MIVGDVTVTDRQLRVLRTISEWTKQHGYAPSTLELCDVLNIKSTQGVLKHVDALRKKGLVKRDVATARSLVITAEGAKLL